LTNWVGAAKANRKTYEIDQVVSGMAGAFHLENEVISFKELSFGIPGADVDLTGAYNLNKEKLDFHGALQLQAKASQTISGWKRWLLKPVDPFLSKNGAGTFLRIQVTGTAKEPKIRPGSKPADNAKGNASLIRRRQRKEND